MDSGSVALDLFDVEEPFPRRDGTTSVQLQGKKRQRSGFRSVRSRKDPGFVVPGLLDVEKPFSRVVGSLEPYREISI